MTDEEWRAFEQRIVKRSLEEMDQGRAFGYQISDLERAFELVKPAGDWKLPIDAVVPADTDMGMLDAAVAYYTGGGITVLPAEGGRRVTAPGYYACIGS